MELGGGRRLRGVLDEMKRLEQPKPQFGVVEGGKWLENHVPTDGTPQGSPPPSQVSKTTRVASSGGNHPLPFTPTRSTCVNAYLRVENHSEPPQSLPDTTRTVKRGYKQPPSSYQSPSHIMRTDVYSHVGNLPEPPQSPPDAIRATKKGYKPTQPPSTSSPSCATRTDIPRRVVDVFHNTSGPIGQNPTRSTYALYTPTVAVYERHAPLVVYCTTQHVKTCQKHVATPHHRVESNLDSTISFVLAAGHSRHIKMCRKPGQNLSGPLTVVDDENDMAHVIWWQ